MTHQRNNVEMLDRACGCMLATYRSYGACWTVLATYRLWGLVRLGLYVLYVGNRPCGACWSPIGAVCGLFDRAWSCMLAAYSCMLATYSLLDRAWGCMLATYRSYGACWAELGAVCWQPTGFIGPVGPSLGLYVGNLITDVVRPVLPSLVLYVGCLQLYVGNLQPVGPSLGLYVGNLQVLWSLLGRAWGCMLATYRFYRACWAELGAVCWQPNYRCCEACFTELGAVCWLPTAVCWQPTACWTELGAVCWQPTGLMEPVGLSLGLYVGNLQVL